MHKCTLLAVLAKKNFFLNHSAIYKSNMTPDTVSTDKTSQRDMQHLNRLFTSLKEKGRGLQDLRVDKSCSLVWDSYRQQVALESPVV